MRKNMFKKAAICVAVCSSLSMFSASSLASNVDGSLKGVVTAKASSQPLVGATIEITNSENGYKKTIVVGSDGSFNLSAIPVGQYQVKIIKDGFQTESVDNVNIGIGKVASLEVAMTSGNLEVISVTGARISMVDVTSSEASFNISADELARIPVSADVTSVALLAPGVNLGDSRFEDSKGNSLASFGGSSQAENTYYINGLNMTNFRNGVGGASIPFIAYDSFQVKTGGYSAEFGRSTGGVISAVTKKGKNDFEFGVMHRQDIDSLYGTTPDSYYIKDRCTADGCQINAGDVYNSNKDDITSRTRTDLYASGALIEDTLFVYGLVEFQKREQDFTAAQATKVTTTKDDDPYYLARIDWNINEDHSLMLWGFSDESIKETVVGGKTSSNETGGKSWSLRYTGQLTDDLSMSAMIGKVKYRDINYGGDPTCPLSRDYTSGSRVDLGCWEATTIVTDSDERKQYRVDFDWIVNDEHTLRIGLDTEENTSFAGQNYSGGVYWRYDAYDAGTRLANGVVLDADQNLVREIHYETSGGFGIDNQAIYIEDTWTVTEQLTATLGFRWETFDNKNINGESFIKVDNQFAPRIGLSYDLLGDGDHKIFANVGRYFLPVASNTNVRMAGANKYTIDYHMYSSIDGRGAPALTGNVGNTVVYQTGEPADPRTLATTDLKPMYQDEFILGYQGLINEDWSWGVKAMHRKVGSIIDDLSVVLPNGEEHWLLANPGKDLHFYADANHDGNVQEFSISAEQAGYPEASRKYSSVDLTLERAWDGLWMFKATYTWAHSYGNAEGYVKSDNGQDDAGLTTDWDYPYLMDGAYGNLPNDRRHSLKLFGSYAITENLMIGLNSDYSTGRPRNIFGLGYYPDEDAYHYGNTYWVGDKKFARGSFGRTPSVFNVNANIKYTLPEMGFLRQGSIALNIYNLFDDATPTRYIEEAETIAQGNANPAFGAVASFNSPRRAELVLDFRF